MRIAIAVVLLVISSCITPPTKEVGRETEQPQDTPAQDNGLSVEESRRRAEEAYAEMLRREREREDRETTSDDRPDPGRTAAVDDGSKQKPSDQDLSDKRALDREGSEDSAEQALRVQKELQRQRSEALALLQKDRDEERQASLALEAYRRKRPQLIEEARRLKSMDDEEQRRYDQEYDEFRALSEREIAYRNSKLPKADPDRNAFYRLDARRIFPSVIEIPDVRSQKIRLMRNSNAHQFMGYTKGMKYVPAVRPVMIPDGPPRRFRLYDYFRGRPGNYVLLKDGEPVTVRAKGHTYRIVNIYSDGDVLLLLDLERDDFAEYYRLSVDDIVLLLE